MNFVSFQDFILACRLL